MALMHDIQTSSVLSMVAETQNNIIG